MDAHVTPARPRRGFAEPLTSQELELSGRMRQIVDARSMNGAVWRIERAFESLIPEMHATCVMPPADGTLHPEAQMVAIIGPSFAGKSHCMALIEFHSKLRDHVTDGHAIKPLVTINAPSPCTLLTFGVHMLYALGWSGAPPIRLHMVWHHVRQLLIAKGVMAIAVNEMHNMIIGRKNHEIRQLAGAIKGLLVGETIVSAPATGPAAERRAVNFPRERYPVFIFAAGTEEMRVLTDDFEDEVIEQVARRTRELNLAEIPMKRTKEGAPWFRGLDDFLVGLQEAMGHVADARMVTPDAQKRHYKAGSRHWGRVAFIVKRAALIALRNGSQKLPFDYLAEAFAEIYRLSPERNPYVVADVDRIGFPPSPMEAARKLVGGGAFDAS